MTMLATNLSQTAGTLPGSPDAPTYAVVGFDGSASSVRALDAAARLLHDRPGGIEVIYVAHVPAIAAGADIGGNASAEVQQSARTCRPRTCEAPHSAGTSSAVTARSRTS